MTEENGDHQIRRLRRRVEDLLRKSDKEVVLIIARLLGLKVQKEDTSKEE